jgi:transposase-like protein
LKNHGFTGVDLVVSDTHGGLVAAVKKQFHNASWPPSFAEGLKLATSFRD